MKSEADMTRQENFRRREVATKARLTYVKGKMLQVGRLSSLLSTGPIYGFQSNIVMMLIMSISGLAKTAYQEMGRMDDVFR